MVPRIHAGGGSFSGVVAYLTHDAGTPDERRPTSADRMGLVELENLPACEPTTAARIMAGTAREADTLKRLAGVSTRGRKLDKPVYHYSLSWSPDERPVRAEMLEAARGSLQALGMADRQALVVEHTDRAHRHVHVVVNRVSADDGRAASSSNDARTLSSWARTWEREHGVVRCRRRRAPVLERAAASLTRIIKRQPPRRRSHRRSVGVDPAATAAPRTTAAPGRRSTRTNGLLATAIRRSWRAIAVTWRGGSAKSAKSGRCRNTAPRPNRRPSTSQPSRGSCG